MAACANASERKCVNHLMDLQYAILGQQAWDITALPEKKEVNGITFYDIVNITNVN
jgi:hypothetical protein